MKEVLYEVRCLKSTEDMIVRGSYLLLSMLHIGVGLLLNFRGKKIYEFQKSLKPDSCGLCLVQHVDIKWRFVFPITLSE